MAVCRVFGRYRMGRSVASEGFRWLRRGVGTSVGEAVEAIAESVDVGEVLLSAEDPFVREIVAGAFAARGIMARRCASFAEASRALAARPRIVVLDLSLPDDGVELLREIARRWPEAPVVALSDDDGPARVIEALRAGASGYVLKRDLYARLPAAIDDALAGRLPLSAGVVGAVLRHLRRGDEGPAEVTLTSAERALLEGLARGLSYAQCACAAEVSVNTVRTHIRAMYRKLEVCTKTEAVLAGLRRGLIELP